MREMLKKRFFEGMGELEELSKGVLAIPVPEREREEAYEMTRRMIERGKQEKVTATNSSSLTKNPKHHTPANCGFATQRFT
jgi:hypothetical protein